MKRKDAPGFEIDPLDKRNMGLNYVDVVTKGFEGSINLFYGDYCLCLVKDLKTAAQLRKEVKLRSK